MTDEQDIAAAEYVLGVMSAEERARFAALLSEDPELPGAVEFWQTRFSALDEGVEPVTPSVELWRRIETGARGPVRSVAPEPRAEQRLGVSDNVVQLRRRLAFWRGATLGAAALAAALAGVVVLDRASVAPPAAGRYVAVVDTGGHEPALIAEVDTATGLISVRSLQANTPAGHSLELWHVPEGKAPVSLGVLKAGADAQTIRNGLGSGPVQGLIAVSVEPQGGSPTGAPTGPVVYSGRLIPVE